jgi:hypothetical protein
MALLSCRSGRSGRRLKYNAPDMPTLLRAACSFPGQANSMPFVEVNDIQLYYGALASCGRSGAMILIHGATGTGRLNKAVTPLAAGITSLFPTAAVTGRLNPVKATASKWRHMVAMHFGL